MGIGNSKSDKSSSSPCLIITAKGDDSYGNITHFYELPSLVDVWTENFQSYGLDVNGNLYAWGLNDYGQLGNGSHENYVFPKTSQKYSFVNTLSIINQSHSFVEYRIFNNQNPLYLKRINKISCGDGFTVCLDTDGVIYSWGKCNSGQLGYEIENSDATIISGNKCQTSPMIVRSLCDRNIKLIDISCGRDFVYALDIENSIFSWGSNSHSQLGRTSTKVVEGIPEVADLYEIGKPKIIKCGWMHAVVLNDKNETFILGNPFYDYDNTFPDIKIPQILNLESKILKIDSGFHHICLIAQEEISKNYNLYTFGANEYGQCGFIISKETKLIFSPSKVSLPDTSLKDSICGAFHTICIMEEDLLLAFGYNFNKELGDYSSKVIDRPVTWGWTINQEKKYKIKKVLCGNGSTIIMQSQD